MIDFRPIRLEDRDWIIACRDVVRHLFLALSFQSLLTWQREYGLLIGGDSYFWGFAAGDYTRGSSCHAYGAPVL